MTRITKEMLEETVDAVLQQQFISDDGSILNRKKNQAIKITGTRVTYIRVRNLIMDGMRYILGERMDKFVDYLSSKFQVPKNVFDEKMAALGDQVYSMDIKMKFFMIISALREFWQDTARNEIIKELKKLIENISEGRAMPTLKEVNEILSTSFSSDFSMLINIRLLQILGKLARINIQPDEYCYEIMDKLAVEIMLKLIEGDI
ncbi:MAG: hypothetical protein ACTSVI_07515 [Promethearchaeota archaeon]